MNKTPPADPWRSAVMDQCAIAHMPFYEDDPRKTLEGLLLWHSQVALDPKVSDEASKLQETIPESALIDLGKMILPLYAAQQVLNGRNQNDIEDMASVGIKRSIANLRKIMGEERFVTEMNRKPFIVHRPI